MQPLFVSLARPSVALVLLLVLAAPSPAQGPGSQTVRYAYDAAGRLVRASYDHGPSTRYTYDASSNVLRVVTENEPFATARAAPARAQPGGAGGLGSPGSRARWAALSIPLVLCCAFGAARRARARS